MPVESRPGAVALALAPRTVRRSLKIALLVGTVLAAINYGDRMLAGTMTGLDYIKMLLTYLVPYAVATWSAVGALRQQ